LVGFHYFDNISNIVISCVALLVMSIILKKMFDAAVKDDWCSEPLLFGTIITGIITVTLAIHVFVGVPRSAKECYKAKYAPRVLIIEKLTK